MRGERSGAPAWFCVSPGEGPAEERVSSGRTAVLEKQTPSLTLPPGGCREGGEDKTAGVVLFFAHRVKKETKSPFQGKGVSSGRTAVLEKQTPSLTLCIDRGHGLHMFGDIGNRYPIDIMLQKAQKCNLSCHEVNVKTVRILGKT